MIKVETMIPCFLFYNAYVIIQNHGWNDTFSSFRDKKYAYIHVVTHLWLKSESQIYNREYAELDNFIRNIIKII